jgi:hypothetical protein
MPPTDPSLGRRLIGWSRGRLYGGTRIRRCLHRIFAQGRVPAREQATERGRGAYE